MNSTKQLLLIFGLVIWAWACQKEPFDFQNETVRELPSIQNVSFGDRITYYNKSIRLNNEKSNSPEHYWEYVAKVEAPVYQGKTLSAAHIALHDNFAYVSYNLFGDEHLGALEVVDLNNKSFPTLANQAFYDKMDINAIAADPDGSYSQRKLWLAGSHSAKGAVLRQIELSNGLLSNIAVDVNLSKALSSGISASANGVVKSGNRLYVSSGKSHGGTFCLDLPSLSFNASESYTNAKYIATNASESKVATLITGRQASIHAYGAQLSNKFSFNTAGIVHQNVANPLRGKSTLHFADEFDNVCFVAAAANGLKAYDINTGDSLGSSLSNMLKKGNCNSITSDQDYLYLANGADGISIAELPSIAKFDSLRILFSWDMDDNPASANYITADGEWVFIAKGNGGFVILRKKAIGALQSINGHNSEGVPEGLEADKPVCSSLLPNIYTLALPEGQNALINKPQYFGNTVKEMYLKDTADVFLTFVNEGAGYKNVLGYYYYEKGNPPQTAEDVKNKLVIFPNCSAQGSGGGLVKGNTMRLLGKFNANTVIGFFLIANGWKNGEITSGLYTHYTNPSFNLDQTTQSILFQDTTCNSTVIAFEDIAVKRGGDKDFNDAIFEISASPANALEVKNLIEI